MDISGTCEITEDKLIFTSKLLGIDIGGINI